jgi:hypothetical protein
MAVGSRRNPFGIGRVADLAQVAAQADQPGSPRDRDIIQNHL